MPKIVISQKKEEKMANFHKNKSPTYSLSSAGIWIIQIPTL